MCEINAATRLRAYLRFMQHKLFNMRKSIFFYIKFKLSLIYYNLKQL